MGPWYARNSADSDLAVRPGRRVKPFEYLPFFLSTGSGPLVKSSSQEVDSKPEQTWVAFLKRIFEHSLSKIGMIAAENELLSEDLEWSTPSDDAAGEFVGRSYILIDGIVYMRISDYCAKTDAYYCSPALPADDGNYLVSDPLNTRWRKIKIGPAEDYGQLFNNRTGQLMRDAYPETIGNSSCLWQPDLFVVRKPVVGTSKER